MPEYFMYEMGRDEKFLNWLFDTTILEWTPAHQKLYKEFKAKL